MLLEPLLVEVVEVFACVDRFFLDLRVFDLNGITGTESSPAVVCPMYRSALVIRESFSIEPVARGKCVSETMQAQKPAALP